MNIGELAAVCAVILLLAVCFMLAAAGCDLLVDYLVRPVRLKYKRVWKKRRKGI